MPKGTFITFPVQSENNLGPYLTLGTSASQPNLPNGDSLLNAVVVIQGGQGYPFINRPEQILPGGPVAQAEEFTAGIGPDKGRPFSLEEG